MATTLRQVLNAFESANRPLSLAQMARDLDIEPGLLEGMLQHWVRKGKLREVNGDIADCATCGRAEGCPLAMKLPRRYELVK